MMVTRSHQRGRRGMLMMAISGIDIALWDIIGQATRTPLYRLLGGYRDTLQAYASAGFYAEHKINVNAIAPGVVDTPFWQEVDKQFARIMNVPIGEPKRRAIASIPLGRIEQPEDITGLAVFLASNDSDYMTQQCINVDGGNWPG